MKINWVDIIFVILIIWGISAGKKKGLSVELGKGAVVLVSWFCALTFYQGLGISISKWFLLSVEASSVVAYVIIYAFAFLLSLVSIRVLRKIMTLTFIPKVEKTGGMVLGGVKGIFFCMALSILFALIPNKLIHREFYENSFLGRYFVDVTPSLYSWLRGGGNGGGFDRKLYYTQTGAGKKGEIL